MLVFPLEYWTRVDEGHFRGQMWWVCLIYNGGVNLAVPIGILSSVSTNVHGFSWGDRSYLKLPVPPIST